MAYEKRVCVLKQIKKGFTADGSALSGAVYCERLNSRLTITPRIAGIAPVKEGRYVLVFSAGSPVCFDLGSGESLSLDNAPSIQNGFSVLLCFVRGDAEPVAFGNCGTASSDFLPLLQAVTEREEKKRKAVPTPLPPNELPPTGPNVPRAPFVPMPDFPEKEAPDDRACFRETVGAAYDDEAIASDNYYRNGVPQEHRNETSAGESDGENQTQTGGDRARENDEAVHPFLRTEGKLTYYKEMRDGLEKAFRKYPKDTRLLGAFPQSEWVNANGALLGVIYENGTPKYLCVATEKNGDPPDEIKNKCTFVPTTPFSEDAGFYVVFQSADTGEYVTVSNT